jgi:hypothetical protein
MQMREVSGNRLATTLLRGLSTCKRYLQPVLVQVIETLIERKDLSEQQAEDALGVSESTCS